MGLNLGYLRDRKEGQMFIADRRLWQTADRSRLVEDGDPEAAFLFCTPGDEVAEEEAKRYGLTKAAPPLEDKAVKAPPGDKAAEPEPGTPGKIMEPEIRRQRKRRKR